MAWGPGRCQVTEGARDILTLQSLQVIISQGPWSSEYLSKPRYCVGHTTTGYCFLEVPLLKQQFAYSGLGMATILSFKGMKYGAERSNQPWKEILCVEALRTKLSRILPDATFPCAKQVNCEGADVAWG